VYKYRCDSRRFPRIERPAEPDRISGLDELEEMSRAQTIRVESAEEVLPRKDSDSDVSMSIYEHDQHQSIGQCQPSLAYSEYSLNLDQHYQKASEEESRQLSAIDSSPIPPFQRSRDGEGPELTRQPPIINVETPYEEDAFLRTPQGAEQLLYADLDEPCLASLDQSSISDFGSFKLFSHRTEIPPSPFEKNDLAIGSNTPSRVMRRTSFSSSNFNLFDGDVENLSMSATASVISRHSPLSGCIPTSRRSESENVRVKLGGGQKFPQIWISGHIGDASQEKFFKGTLDTQARLCLMSQHVLEDRFGIERLDPTISYVLDDLAWNRIRTMGQIRIKLRLAHGQKEIDVPFQVVPNMYARYQFDALLSGKLIKRENILVLGPDWQHEESDLQDEEPDMQGEETDWEDEE
jgi:hypothetical protein